MGKRSLKPAAPAPEVDDFDLEDENEGGFISTSPVDDDEDDLWDEEDEDNGDGDPAAVRTSCIYCGCTQEHACQTPDGPCSWLATEQDVCTNPECLAKHQRNGNDIGEFAEDLVVDPIDEANPSIAEREASYVPPIDDADQIVELRVDDIVPDPDQPRLEVDAELADSIRAQGVLQPILVRPNPTPGAVVPYMIEDGERRWRGARAAGLALIRGRINTANIDAGDRLLRQVTLNEGKRLAPMEEAKAWKRIIDAKGWNIQQLASALGRAKSTVSDRLALLEAPLPFHKYFLDGTLTAAAAPIVRRFAGVSDKVAEQMINFAKSGPGWEEAVDAGKPVPLKVVEEELTLAVTDEMPLLVDGDPVAARYNGPSVVIKRQRFALDPDLYDAADKSYEDERQAAEPAASAAGAPTKKVKRAPDPYVAKQRAEAKRAKEKSELRATQIQLLAPKLPTKLDRRWGLFLVEYLVRELTTDSQRHAVKVLGITPPKLGNSGFQFDKAILKHAESLKAEQLLPLAFTLLLAGDCYVSSYGGNEAKRITAAAKLLKVDLKKLKAPAPVAPKRVAGKPDFMQPQQPDAALAAIVGKGPMPRTEITVKLWAYIKKNGLQDAKERRMINADAKLGLVFNGKKRVSMFEMTKVVNKHIIGPKGGKR